MTLWAFFSETVPSKNLSIKRCVLTEAQGLPEVHAYQPSQMRQAPEGSVRLADRHSLQTGPLPQSPRINLVLSSFRDSRIHLLPDHLPPPPLSLSFCPIFRGMSGFLRNISFWQVDLASFLNPKERTKDWTFSLPKISIPKEGSSVCLDHGQCWQCLHLNSPYEATRPHCHLNPPHVPSLQPHTSASQRS